jgi:hypothetical protein
VTEAAASAAPNDPATSPAASVPVAPTSAAIAPAPAATPARTTNPIDGGLVGAAVTIAALGGVVVGALGGLLAGRRRPEGATR